MSQDKDKIIADLLARIERLESQQNNPLPRYLGTRSPPMAQQSCVTHGRSSWIDSYPAGTGYCHQCAKDAYAKAPRCPGCGVKIGYAMGTGDCGCGED